MNNEQQAKRWLSNLFLSIVSILGILMILAYVVDPFLYYRSGDNKYLLKSRFVTRGLIDNADYDTVIIGSSMVQNFNLQSFRDKLDYNPIKATISNMTVSEIKMMNRLVRERGQAKRLIINLDMTQFNKDISENRFPDYLYDDSSLNDYQYLLGYETWMRYLPVDIMVNALYQSGIDLPQKFDYAVNPDRIEDWSLDYDFSAEIVKKQYEESDLMVSSQNMEGQVPIMCARFDAFLDELQLDPEKETIFLLPPYSALYWHYAESEGYKSELLEFKTHIVKKLSQYENVRLVDMQDINEITNLNHYKDITHYDPTIQEMIVDGIQSGLHDASADNIQEKIDHLLKLVASFEEENSDWL